MTTQVSVNAYGRLLRSLQVGSTLGTYRVRLDNIELPTIPPNRKTNVTRLEKVFHTQKCFRDDPQNFIKASIQRDVFENHSSIIRSSDGVDELLLRAEDSVSCVHGASRIQAAKLVLRGRDRWWTVVLYKEDIDPRAKRKLRDEYANQLSPPDGTIYVNLQKSLQNNDLDGTNQWRAYLTTDKRRYLRQLCNSHGGIVDAFNKLLPMESLFMGKNAFHVGVFHKLGSLHCDQELINYLTDVASFWSTISNNGAYAFNVDFIDGLQGRCPKFSRRDHEYLHKSLESDGVLGYLSRSDRGHVFHAVVLYNRTIPSLFTFFQDWKYVQICCEVLTSLLAVDDQPGPRSLRECFDALFHRPDHMVVQTGHSSFQTCLIQERSDCFRLAYWQIWLCAMRLWPSLLMRRGRKRRHSPDERFSSAYRKAYWSIIAQNALRLGFRSSHLEALAGNDNPRTLANSPRYPGLTGAVEKNGWDRYGTPFDDKYDLDRNSLFLPNLFLNPSELERVEIGEDVTTLLVRRSLFLRIFPDCEMPPSVVTVATEPRHPVSPLQAPSMPRPTTVPSSAPRSPAHSMPRATTVPSSVPHSPTHSHDSMSVDMDSPYERTSAMPAAVGDYHVDVWNRGHRVKSKTLGTKEQWILDLRSFIRHHFSLWDPDTLGAVGLDEIEIYPKTRIIATPRNFDINNLRRARGIGAEGFI